jgi:hypothetical protein
MSNQFYSSQNKSSNNNSSQEAQSNGVAYNNNTKEYVTLNNLYTTDESSFVNKNNEKLFVEINNNCNNEIVEKIDNDLKDFIKEVNESHSKEKSIDFSKNLQNLDDKNLQDNNLNNSIINSSVSSATNNTFKYKLIFNKYDKLNKKADNVDKSNGEKDKNKDNNIELGQNKNYNITNSKKQIDVGRNMSSFSAISEIVVNRNDISLHINTEDIKRTVPKNVVNKIKPISIEDEAFNRRRTVIDKIIYILKVAMVVVFLSGLFLILYFIKTLN